MVTAVKIGILVWACLSIGGIIGFSFCAILTVGKRADEHARHYHKKNF